MLPPNINLDSFPQLYRDAFEAISCGEEAPGKCFGLCMIEINGNPEIAICSLLYDVDTGAVTGMLPLFIAYPHSERELAQYEKNNAENSDRPN